MRVFREIRSKRWLFAKGGLFLLLAVTAGSLLVLRSPQWDVLVLLVICVWASCRAYYFAFYVIEHYIDSEFRFSGLIDFLRYAVAGNTALGRDADPRRGSKHE